MVAALARLAVGLLEVIDRWLYRLSIASWWRWT